MDLRWSTGCAAGAVALAVALGGCGQSAVGAAAAEPVAAPEPIPSVEPTCIAEYPGYSSAVELVSRASVVVRVEATGPSRDYKSYPLPPSSDDPRVSPQAGMSPEEFAAYREEAAIPSTAITVRALEVLKGDVEVGDVLEVNQNLCTERPLPTGEGREYVLALESYDSGAPMSQLNDTQAAWQVAGDGSLVPVNPDNDLGVTRLSQLDVVAETT